MREPLDRDVVLRHEPGFDALARAQPDDLVAATAQHARGRERREHVATGAARHHQGDAATHRRRSARAAGTRPEVTVSWWMRSSTPSHASVTSMLLPP